MTNKKKYYTIYDSKTGTYTKLETTKTYYDNPSLIKITEKRYFTLDDVKAGTRIKLENAKKYYDNLSLIKIKNELDKIEKFENEMQELEERGEFAKENLAMAAFCMPTDIISDNYKVKKEYRRHYYLWLLINEKVNEDKGLIKREEAAFVSEPLYYAYYKCFVLKQYLENILKQNHEPSKPAKASKQKPPLVLQDIFFKEDDLKELVKMLIDKEFVEQRKDGSIIWTGKKFINGNANGPCTQLVALAVICKPLYKQNKYQGKDLAFAWNKHFNRTFSENQFTDGQIDQNVTDSYKNLFNFVRQAFSI